jgi:dTDP-4-dehydrorhamnose reductase
VLQKDYEVGSISRGQYQNGFTFDLRFVEAFDFSIFDVHSTVIFFAGISSPDFCESSPQESFEVNVRGTIGFIGEVLERGSKVIFLSSDAVYGESADAAEELGPLNPKGNYGKFKLAVEKAFVGNGNFKAVRLSYVYTSDDKFSSYLMQCYLSKQTAFVFESYARSIVHIDDVTLGLRNLISGWESLPFQAINFAGPRCMSRLEFAHNYKVSHNLDELKLELSAPPQDYFMARAMRTECSTTLFQKLLNKQPRSIF